MKQKTVGTYSDGVDHYVVVLTEGDDSCGCNRAENANTGLIRIGADVCSEEELYDSLLHEILELIFLIHGFRYQPTISRVKFGGNILFSFSHVDWCEMCAMASRFMIKAWPDLLKAWKQWGKK